MSIFPAKSKHLGLNDFCFCFSGEIQVPLNSIDLAGPVDEWKDLAPLDDGSDQYLVRNYLNQNFSNFSCRFLNPNDFF